MPRSSLRRILAPMVLLGTLVTWAWVSEGTRASALRASSPAVPRDVVLRFAVVGDTQGQHLFDQLLSDMNAQAAEVLVIPGDLVDTGGTPAERFGSWSSWIEQASAFAPGLTRIVMAPGNHDLPSGGDARWRETFRTTPDGEPWLPDSPPLDGEPGLDQMDYFVDVGATRFISITTDTEKYGASHLSARSLVWLERALLDAEEQDGVEHVFVLTHHPVTFDSLEGNLGGTNGAGWQTMSGCSKLRALFAGHWHLYQPSRPDPMRPGMWEVVSGTGGGGLEGRPVQNRHGFLLVDVHRDGRVEARFHGDSDGSENGWAFDDVLDRFTLRGDRNQRPGPVAHFGFEHAPLNLDSVRGPRSKAHRGRLHGDARTCVGARGTGMRLSGQGFADAVGIGDYDLALVGDLGLSLMVRLDPDHRGQVSTLVEYSAATGHPSVDSEAVNTLYSLRLLADRRLELRWEHDDGKAVSVSSTEPLRLSDRWQRITCSRSAWRRRVRFFVNGFQLGKDRRFDRSPTGGGAGFLHIGRSADGSAPFVGQIDEVSIFDRVLGPRVPEGIPEPPDPTGDGRLDEADFKRLARELGSGKADRKGEALSSDADGDGDVDLQDFAAWRARRDNELRVRPGEGPRPIHLVSTWELRGSLADQQGQASLRSLGGELLTDSYAFGANRGLELVDWPEDRWGADYVFEMVVALSDFGNGKWGKLVDFKARRSDHGLYVRTVGDESFLEFFQEKGRGGTPLQRGRFHHLVLAREAGSQRFRVWLDGQLEIDFVDDSGWALFDGPGHRAVFFVDDGGAETVAGSLARLRLLSGTVEDADVSRWAEAMVPGRLPRIRIDRASGEARLENASPEPLAFVAFELTSRSGSIEAGAIDLGSDWIVARAGATRRVWIRPHGERRIEAGTDWRLGRLWRTGAEPDLRFEVLEASRLESRRLPVHFD